MTKVVVKIDPDLFRSFDYDTLEVINIEKSIYHKLAGDKDSITLKISDEVILNLSHGRNHSYIHLKPGYDILLDTIESGPMLLGLIGFQTKENDYLVDFDSVYIDLTMSFGTQFLAKNEVDKFLELINRKYASLNQLIITIKKDPDVSQYFKTAMYHRYIACKGNDLLKFKSMYSSWHKRIPELPNHYFDEVKIINDADPTVLIFADGREFGKSWVKKDVVNLEGYNRAFKENAAKIYPNSLLRDYCHYIATTGHIDEEGGIDKSQDMIKDFRTSVKNEYLKIKMEETVTPWLHLKSGTCAPDFEAMNKEGDAVYLSELKGKKVYIDVWATWCAPCIKEIPFLKKLEVELQGNDIEFVSVSLDKYEHRNIWLKFLDDHDLKGQQWMTKEDWASGFAINYNVTRTGVPRFLFIDEEGKIIDAYALKPSDPKIKEILLN